MLSREALRAIRVLVVEDEADTRNLLGVVLQLHGALPITASGVSEGLAYFNDRDIDVVVTDIGMPEHNGYELLAAIRKHEDAKKRTTPVIALTAYARQADRDRAMASGFDEYVTKPFDLSELVRSIRRLFETRLNRVA